MITKRNFRQAAKSQASSVLDIKGATTLVDALDYALDNQAIFPELVMYLEQSAHKGMAAEMRRLVKQIKVAGKDVSAYLPFKTYIALSGDDKGQESLLWKRIELMESRELSWAMDYQRQSTRAHVDAYNRLVDHVNETRPDCGNFSCYGE
jgi:hypothetical protein